MTNAEIEKLRQLYAVAEDGCIYARKTLRRHTAVDDRGRPTFYIGKKKFSARRVVWALLNGEWPRGPVRSVDGTQTNNAPSNLFIDIGTMKVYSRARCLY